MAETLQADYDVIMVDAHGHGKSDGPEHGYGAAEYAADYAGVIKGLQLTRPAVPGHSMGAMTALALAGLYPDLPGKILLEDPPPFWFPMAKRTLPGRRSGMGSGLSHRTHWQRRTQHSPRSVC